MAGIDPVSGGVLDELADIRRSIADIVKTPVGTRVMRRDYGSHVFDMVDAPGTDFGTICVIAAVADAVARWEPRVVMRSARVTVGLDGRATIAVTCAVNASGLTITADAKLGGPARPSRSAPHQNLAGSGAEVDHAALSALSRRFDDLVDLYRRFEALICLGTIAEVNHASARVRLDLSGRKTGWLPYPAEIGANFRRWRPLRVGTKVLAACPSDDPANPVIVQILYTDALPPPETSGTVDVIQWTDGTCVRYDSATRKIQVVSAGDLTLAAPVGTVVLDAMNLVIRTGERGYCQFDHAGRATRTTHMGEAAFDQDAWTFDTLFTARAGHDFSPPKLISPGEGG